MPMSRKYVVTKNFDGLPKKSDFKIVENELPPLTQGEILVKALWISVDPYLFAYNAFLRKIPYDQFGFQVGIVEESKDPEYPVGTKVVTHMGWCDRYIVNPSTSVSSFEISSIEEMVNKSFLLYKLPNLPEGLSPSLGLGAVGMPGATAYFGFLEVCKPKPGETVVVTGAGGAIGSLVGQIAKIKGCRVIGFTGSDDKAMRLEKDLKFDKAFNYKKVNIAEALKRAAPNGVDCYFDNVGGEISSTIIYHMNKFGRVAICGTMSSYINGFENLPKVTPIQLAIVLKQLKVEGFIVSRWRDWSQAFEDITKWIQNGNIKASEHITEGFDNLLDALNGLLAGDNFGKAVVKV